MILRALYDLAQQEGLAEDLDFEMKPVRFMIVLGADGSAHLKDTAVLETPKRDKGKPRHQIPALKIPRQSGRTSGDKAEFLVDKCDYVFGSNPNLFGGKTKKLPERAKLFVDQVEKLSSYPELNLDEHKAITALLNFLQQPQDKREAIFQERWEKAATEAERKNITNALFAFEFGPLGSTPIHLLPGIIAYWRKSRAAEETSNLPKAKCLVTGRIVVANRQASSDKRGAQGQSLRSRFNQL
ncbi:MAG: type I-C CRISPR-associated protein Cas8c/Csd1 [Clostridiales bacterium]|nr:type I-C CRISPR-associated protein Cas8c/Csd1 [Clostridiales bacterium]